MKKALILLAFVMASPVFAQEINISNFQYGHQLAPVGDEWQSPEKLALNKEMPRAYMFSFANEEEAKGVLPQKSSYYKCLDGTWKFNWVATPNERPKNFYEQNYDVSSWDDIEVPGCWNVQGLGKHGEMKYGVPLYVNQPVMFYHEVKVNDWKEGVMREPKDQRFTTYKYRNEIGSYRRNFTVPSNWDGRNIYINFDGVDSFFYLWINGRYVGFSKNSRNTARFDITPYIIKGENSVSVEVYRSSDGSFLEAQDMFRLPGIFRSTYLTSMPKVRIEDLAVRTESIKDGHATIKVNMNIVDGGKKKQKAYNPEVKIYPVRLYSDEIDGESVCGSTQTNVPFTKMERTYEAQLKPWSAEVPNRYVLVAMLKDKKGNIMDCVSTYFGVCKVEIKDTEAKDDEFGLAGRYFYVNNKPVKLKGVNRHETSLDRGHAITHKQMEEEVFLMKRANINHIRMSHYSNDPYMYYLCDKYGIYLEDECNLESHEYYYGNASLSHPTEWKAAHVARNMEMVHAHINHPSIVIWSLGNEAGPGENFKAAYDAIKAFDTSRPVQYERNNDIVDMGSNQYPGVDWVRYAVKGTDKGIKYPYHISEYAHSMGNSLGNLVDYWEAIESTNFFCGAAIWDWVDQAIDTYTPDGIKYMGYGGDHGDWPNDGMFCMNGILLPDFTPKPQYFEVKKVYQNVGVTLDTIISKGNKQIAKLKIQNKNYFQSLDYDVVAKVVRDGKVIKTFNSNTIGDEFGPLKPRKHIAYMYALNMDEPGEYLLNIEFQLKKDMPWAKKGYVQMDEQLYLGKTIEPTILSGDKKELKVTRGGSATNIQGESWNLSFEDSDGSINNYCINGTYLIESGNGPKLDAFRAPIDNDNWARDQWVMNGLHNLKHKTTAPPTIKKNNDGSISVTYNIFSQGETSGRLRHRPGKAGEPYESIDVVNEMTADDFHFNSVVTYTVYQDGTIDMESSIVSSNPALALPRLGYVMKMPKTIDNYTYYGRGPLNNYADRKTGSFIGIYESKVKDQFVNFPKPQSMGNREDVRWCALTKNNGIGLQFISGDKMSTSALPWSAMQMTLAQHPYQLPESDGTYLHLDCQVTGLGGNSCGQGGPLKQDRVMGKLHQMSIIIRPINAATNLTDNANVKSAIGYPKIEIKDNNNNITLEINYVSSEEGDYESAQNLLDGDPTTIWHTMYSITVPKYPHWIEFDCKSIKTIKGFTYMPRQDGGHNGDIKDYKIEISNDGKTWTGPIAEGTFENNSKTKRVNFNKSCKARYIRFTALSSQNGADFASGAEFSIISE